MFISNKKDNSKQDKTKLFELLSKECPQSLTPKLNKFISKYKWTKETDLLYKEDKSISFELSVEHAFFQYLLSIDYGSGMIYKYCDFDTLNYILKDKSLLMSSIIGMNDNSEGIYTRLYLKDKIKQGKMSHLKPYLDKNDKLESYDYYITSFSRLSDDLTMWRLYGDDGKGVCLGFSSINMFVVRFLLAPVTYADGDTGVNPILDYIFSIMYKEVNGKTFTFRYWPLWRMFFKSENYKIEDEVRLLFRRVNYIDADKIELMCSKRQNGIVAPRIKMYLDKSHNMYATFPLQLQSVTLGPRFPLKEESKEIIDMCLQNKFKNDNGYHKINVTLSNINDYRG